ncbi:hypothetical protein SERLA73DRAFT_181198 [Serpula lacrymans var. lacrymans S7.3]|uniref:Uncharacterized protein n=2 Tax=Serpula lacrymans var. lacrymans TaxID=341189 RepID=F8PXM7_SERL3|nr:uncharacterized protein SERLADRAFT_467138 [Serpula lacrymans var. lacrymans S7.9]EGN98640.1 hypothetical protein SERLA73DRAFT_181198 [Serpula lacrymans var. lacrymans S7.3]EGO24209.1 hypothetical protein SERLADRAFT_467138 [Serpula lacrymans var. lacrymans S7.9]
MSHLEPQTNQKQRASWIGVRPNLRRVKSPNQLLLSTPYRLVRYKGIIALKCHRPHFDSSPAGEKAKISKCFVVRFGRRCRAPTSIQTRGSEYFTCEERHDNV